jgi:hypothetical protein
MPERKIVFHFRRSSTDSALYSRLYNILCSTLRSLLALLALSLATLACTSPALAATVTMVTTAASSPSMNVTMGFDSRYRDGNWVPVQVSLSNNGPDFTGAVAVNVPTPYYTGSRSTTTYEMPVALATGAQKQVTLYIPLSLGISGSTTNVDVNLIDSAGNLVKTQSLALRALSQGDLFIGLLSDQTGGFGSLNAVSLPNQTGSLIIEPLNAGNFPTQADVLKNFDLLIFDNFTTSTLSQQQLAALQSWVSQGGELLLVGGPEWRRTLSPLPTALLPIEANNTTTLPAGTAILPVGSPGNSGTGNTSNATLSTPVIVSTGMVNANSVTVLSANNTPLISQKTVGNGQVCYVAFDPTLDPIANWPRASLLWQGLLFRTLGDAMLARNAMAIPASTQPFNQDAQYISGLVQTFLPNTFPSVTLILVILLSYVFILGPVRFFIVRRFKRRDWNWRIVLATIILFSLLSYGIALEQKGTTIVSDTISVVQLDYPHSGSSQANVNTYLGVFVPNAGDYHIHVNNASMVQSQSSLFGQTPNQSMIVVPGPNGTDVELHGVDIWTLHTISIEQQQHIQGGIVSHLTLNNGTLIGSVTNTLPYTLSDVYVLMGSNYTHLGTLAAGQTQQVNLPINVNTSNSGMLLGEEIASAYGYNNYGNPPQNEEQRHLAMLAALSGDGPYACGGGGTCYGGPAYKVMTSNGVVINSSGGPPTVDKQDPLLLNNAPATLIGWADNPTDAINAITVNGNTPTGSQEVMIQAPLNMTYAGNVSLPSTLLTGQLINAQNQSGSGSNTGVQEALPGIYTMTTGSATFEITIPSSWQLHITSATINESSNMNQIIQQTGMANSPVSDISTAQAYLYNWQTHQWDTASMDNNDSITINNPQTYISSDGRLLVQFVNQDATKGTIAFSTPNLQVQGTA